MNRCLAMILALLFASMSVASACAATPKINAIFSNEEVDRGETHWSAAFPPSQIIGLDIAGFRGVGARPVSLAVMREVRPLGGRS